MIIKRDVLKDNVFDLIPNTFIFEEDNYIYELIRNNIDDFINKTIINHKNINILEVGPKKNGDDRFKENNCLETVDICNNSNPTYVADLTKENNIPKEKFDVIYCLEVIEHTFEPSNILYELYKLLKKDGILYISMPFQIRIHGPLPDCYRISEFGLKYLLEKNNFKIIEFTALIDDKRPAFPLHYTIICKK